MNEARKGLASLVAACLIWGLAPIYYRHLGPIQAGEMMAHRTIWSLVFFWALLVLQGRARAPLALIAGPSGLRTVFAAAMVASNWFLFIWAVLAGRAVSASLGYFIFPLMMVAAGLAAGERRSPGKLAALGLALAAVLILTLGLGVAPWISLTLATTFTAYSLIKRRSRSGALVSVTAEAMLVAPFVLVFLIWSGASAFGPAHPWQSLGLMLLGPLTAGPLILFSYASQRLAMATLGLGQYLNPSLQFLVAVLVFGEPLSVWHLIAFPLIWLGLALYSFEAIRQERQSRRAAMAAAASGATAI